LRLNKFIAETGACSRRQADALIAAGRVTVNGKRAGLGTQVAAGDEVKVDGETVGRPRDRPRPVYIALNKPVGVTCTTDRRVPGNIVDFVDHPERIFPIGRLDKDSEGLILLTNDGDIVNEVLRAEHHHEKEYLVAVDRPITDEFIAKMAAGVRIPASSRESSSGDRTDVRLVMTRPCKVFRVEGRVFRIILTQGMNRQIRKMCEALGYQVLGLQRIRIMHIELGTLKVGRWRNLREGEIRPLLAKPRRSERR
jgi:23S rRNA pseudouridine2604 synthase